MKKILAIILIALSVNISAQSDSEELVNFISEIMIGKLSSSYIIDTGYLEGGGYYVQIKCSKHSDFSDISFAWKYGIAEEYSDITIIVPWTRNDDNSLSMGFTVDGYNKSIYILRYNLTDKTLMIVHGYIN
jgi:hypothetical protein